MNLTRHTGNSQAFNLHRAPLDKNFCRLCSADLIEVGGLTARVILPSGTIEHLPMCFVCEVNLNYKEKPTLAAFARVMMQMVITHRTVEGGAS